MSGCAGRCMQRSACCFCCCSCARTANSSFYLVVWAGMCGNVDSWANVLSGVEHERYCSQGMSASCTRAIDACSLASKGRSMILCQDVIRHKCSARSGPMLFMVLDCSKLSLPLRRSAFHSDMHYPGIKWFHSMRYVFVGGLSIYFNMQVQCRYRSYCNRQKTKMCRVIQ